MAPLMLSPSLSASLKLMMSFGFCYLILASWSIEYQVAVHQKELFPHLGSEKEPGGDKTEVHHAGRHLDHH